MDEKVLSGIHYVIQAVYKDIHVYDHRSLKNSIPHLLRLWSYKGKEKGPTEERPVHALPAFLPPGRDLGPPHADLVLLEEGGRVASFCIFLHTV